ncbi:putative tetrahydrofolate synthase [Microsporum ferrugineum]
MATIGGSLTERTPTRASATQLSGLQRERERARSGYILNPKHQNLTNRFSRAVQESYAEFWRSFDATATVSCERTIEEALYRARAMGDQESGMQALVTGSLHLVSGALHLLEQCLA